MLWFFDRADESLSVETRYDRGTSEFVLIVLFPDGHTQTERFTDADAFRFWLRAFERHLAAKNWTSRGGPIVLQSGWKNGPAQ
jgi:hypothetical protein